MVRFPKYSFGVGDRFAHQAKAQLQACLQAAADGIDVVPVWNKSNREHLIVGSDPRSVRVAADEAVRGLGWKRPYFVDADHIRLDTVGRFIPYADFFTIDVADSIGQPANEADISAMLDRHTELIGQVDIPHIDAPFKTTRAELEGIARQYLRAVQDAGRIYRHIAKAKGEGNFVTEISMDETDRPQTPLELLVILVAIADENVPVETIAPKFSGRFNKGVDYAGNLDQFEKEFNDDLAVIAYARRYGLSESLKLSVHSGSDKFSIYPIIRRALPRLGSGLHLKTAGTTWLEEVIGLAEAGGTGLALAKEIYSQAVEHVDELCAPYATVIDIKIHKLPAAAQVNGWTSAEFVQALRHDPGCPAFNPHLRQLLHVGYKIAAKMGERYLRMLRDHESIIARNVTLNLYQRHLRPLFHADA